MGGLRDLGLYKPPGIAETIDWARALHTLGTTSLDEAVVGATLGAVVKYREDAERVRAHGTRRPRARGGRCVAHEPEAAAGRVRARCCAGAGSAVPGRGHRRLRPGARRWCADRGAAGCVLGRAGHARAPAGGRRRSTTGPSPPSSAPAPRRSSSRSCRQLELVVDDDERSDEAPPAAPATDDDDDGAEVLAVRWSPVEVLADKDLAACSAEELAEAHRLMADLRLRAALRPSRRRRADRRPAIRWAGRPPPHGALGGPPRRRDRPARHHLAGVAPATGRAAARRLGLDGALRPGAGPLRATPPSPVAGAARWRSSPSAPASRASPVSSPPTIPTPPSRRPPRRWPTGTAVPASARACGAFNDEWGVRGLARGAVVVVLSDGWDRGEPG